MSFSKKLIMNQRQHSNSWFSHDVIKVKTTKVYLPQSRFQHGMWIYRKFSGSQDVLLWFMKQNRPVESYFCIVDAYKPI